MLYKSRYTVLNDMRYTKMISMIAATSASSSEKAMQEPCHEEEEM